ncbi:MAG: YIP1 family protein [Clostridiales bacterium]|jgi:hypothetical protein|nr:YIP1 family protein [Clostridiales bacterium]
MENELTRVVTPEAMKMNAGQRIISLLTAPGELFANVKVYPVILVPFLIILVIGLVALVPMNRVSEMQMQELSRISIENYGVDILADMNVDEFGDSAMDSFLKIFTAVVLVVNVAIGPLINSLIYAFGIWVLSKILRGKANFVQLFSMYMHIYVIGALGTLVISGIMMITGNYVDMTSLAALVMPQGDMSMPLFNALSAISIFSLWTTFLTFIGIKVINEFSAVKAGIITALVLLFTIGVTVGSLALTWLPYELGIA